MRLSHLLLEHVESTAVITLDKPERRNALSLELMREFTGVRARENDFEIYKWKAKVGVNFNL